MLQALSEEIRLCYRRAEDCACQAKTAPTEELRADYLRHERNWLELARSYELQQRLTFFINENRKRRAMAGVGHVSAFDLAAGTARVMPGASQIGNDPQRLQNRLVAIVDDDEYARAGLRALMESVGHIVATFASAEEYLASHISEPAACLILDVHLPGMSGPDLQAHLIAAGRCLPIVFATGRFEEHVRMRVIEAGALGYFIKLRNDNELLGCIERVFRAAAA